MVLWPRLRYVARVRDFLDPFVVVDDFERAKIELAHMGGGERIFPSALAALQRFHETIVCLSITQFLLRDRGNKKPLPIG